MAHAVVVVCPGLPVADFLLSSARRLFDERAKLKFVEKVQRAIRLTEELNMLRYADQKAIQECWSELTGQAVEETFHLIPPVYSDHGVNIRIGRNVFVNQGCRFNDVGGIEIGDDVMIGPSVSLITSGHPVEPAQRRTGITAAPIRIERNVWIGASAMIMQGVTVGENAVVAAGAVVTRDVPAGTLVAGVPATVLRQIA
ncbi:MULTISPECIES: DapH/DapD/GlmU-related protein [Nocardia]|uniref:DapH/DapD/GlmU-related protein n=1 Tax=Nocardia TaxID=1817 RepID=UPI00272983F9|nr:MULTISPECIES: DapH/DapD/GlmU-related protein [Nocardia]